MAIPIDPRAAHQTLAEGKHGHFADGGKTFVIKNPRTPLPWINVLANERYGVAISQAGGGFSWFENCQLCRITRWEQDLVQDRQGRFLYLQDLDHADALWSTSFQPTLQQGEPDEVRHSLGSTTFLRGFYGIQSQHTIFVPVTDSCEVWIVRLHNLSTRRRRLRFATYVDWHLGSVGDWHREFHRLFVETRPAGQTLLAWKHPGLIEHHRGQPESGPTAFHAVLETPVKHWMTDKASFIGEQGRQATPKALIEHDFSKGNGRWEDPIASAIGEITLEPGQTVGFVITLGATEDATESLRLADKYSLETAETELARVEDYWSQLCEQTMAETPDQALDPMLNYWLKYQTLAGRMVARCAYYQQGGAFGFRDQLQDSLALLPLAPEKTKRQLLTQAQAMYEDGGVRHWWHPNTDIFAESKHCDTSLWLAYGVLAYLDETDDLHTLADELPFLNRGTQKPGETGSLLDHCMRGIDRALELRSKRGLPLMMAGDWNDGLSHAGLDGKGESVWLGMFLFDILQRFTPVLAALGNTDRAKRFTALAAELKKAVNEHGWDGEWYIEGTTDDGRPLGSRGSAAGEIFLNPQTWAVISGIASDDRAMRAMRSVTERLCKPYGCLLLAPAYSKVDPWVGYITRYAPGSRENGGVYSHASTWAVQAYATIGDVDKAYEVYRSMLPSAKVDQDAYAAEPYVMPGNVDGPDSPLEGRGGWTWYTGSAAWMVRVALDWLLGVRATREGLVVDPKAIEGLSEFRVRRKFRGDTFDILVEGNGPTITLQSSNPDLLVGNRLVSTGLGKRHRVQVRRS